MGSGDQRRQPLSRRRKLAMVRLIAFALVGVMAAGSFQLVRSATVAHAQRAAQKGDSHALLDLGIGVIVIIVVAVICIGLPLARTIMKEIRVFLDDD
jgi:hypothetical protein